MILGLWEIGLVSLIALATVTLGILIFLKNPKKKANQLFTLLTFSFLIWVVSAFLSEIPENLIYSLFLSKITYLGVLLSAFFLFYFSYYFPKERALKKEVDLVVKTLAIILSFLCVSSNLVIKGVSPKPWGFDLVFGRAYFFYLVFCIIVALWAIVNLLRSFKKSSYLERLQLGYLFLGLAIFIGASIVVNVIVRVIVGSDIYYRIGNYSGIFFVTFVALALLKYHLFGIKVILTELLVGLMGIFQLVFSFFLPGIYKFFGLSNFCLFLVFAYYLLKTVHEEEKRREAAEALAQREKILRKGAEKLARERERLAEEYQVLAIRLDAMRKSAQEMAEREKSLRIETERLSRAKDQFILSAQHYFRTPLTSMIGYLSLISEGLYGELPKKVKEKISQVLSSCQELRKRIEEGLTIASFQAGKGILDLKETQIEDLLKEIYEELKIQAQQKNLKFELNLPKISLPKIKIDLQRMREALSNLIENAIKHTQEDGVFIYLENKIKSILLIIKDTGIGIPKEELPYIGTTPFERGRLSQKLSPLGRGIGLYLSRLIIEAHGGSLRIESEGIGKGTTVYVELPIG